MVDALFDLEEKVMAAVEGHNNGAYDGNDIGIGEFTMYMYGPDADRLFDAIWPVLQASVLTKGGYVLKRYGPVEEDDKSIRVEL